MSLSTHANVHLQYKNQNKIQQHMAKTNHLQKIAEIPQAMENHASTPEQTHGFILSEALQGRGLQHKDITH